MFDGDENSGRILYSYVFAAAGRNSYAPLQRIFIRLPCTLSKTTVFSRIRSISLLKWKAFLLYLGLTLSNACFLRNLNSIHAERFQFEQLYSVGKYQAPCSQIFIGGWKNTKSVIRRNRVKPDKAVVDTPNILSNAEHSGFWIRWGAGLVEAGKETDVTLFLKWQDPETFGVRYYGICTGWGATGSWFTGKRV
jgi:hypothetical protein